MSTGAKEEQVVLLRPESPLTPQKSGVIAPNLIAHEECYIEEGFQDSVATFGVMEPVVLTGAETPYVIVGGRRRVKAALIAALPEIPFIWYSDLDDAIAAVASLSFGYLRTDNLFAEIEALEKLTEKHATDKAIAGATGQKIKVVQKRMRLLKLHHMLRWGLRDNSVPPGVALKCCDWTEPEQEQLAKILERNGKLTWVDLAGVRPGKGKAKEAALPIDLTPLQRAGAVLIGYLGESRDRLGETVAPRVDELFQHMVAVGEEIASYFLGQDGAERMRGAIAEFREANAMPVPLDEVVADDIPPVDPDSDTYAATFTIEGDRIDVSFTELNSMLATMTLTGPVAEGGTITSKVATTKVRKKGVDVYARSEAVLARKNYRQTMGGSL